MEAKICKLGTNTVLVSQTHLLRHKRKLKRKLTHTNFLLLPPRGGDVTRRVCENLHPPPRQNGPTCENMQWRLPGSGLRKYALRQNHTIPVWGG